MKSWKLCLSIILPLLLGGLCACGGNKSSQDFSTAEESTTVETTVESTDKPTMESTGAPATENTTEPSTEAMAETATDQLATEQSIQEETDMTNENTNTTPVSLHGSLSVQGTDLVDKNGEKFQLYGMSTHGIAWFPQYINLEAFRTLRDDWNTNCVRLAMYTAENGGYCSDGDKEELKALVKSGVEYASELGMYVIIDWHILSDQDPNAHKEEALSFFREMSSAYADYENVLYEICNEPNGYASWDSVKEYACEVIPVIRENDSDAVILVGSPTWSQDIHQAAASPLEFDNIMYTLHFYAATHKDDLRSRLESCVSEGLPVFISEFGMCDASGNGANDFDQTLKWMELIEKYNISFFCWNLANKNESSSVLLPSSTKTSDWTQEDLSEAGKWIREYFINISHSDS